MGVLGSLVDAQVAELLAAERTARQHALHRLLDDALREAPFQDELGAPLLDAAGIAGVVIVDLVVALATGQHHLLGVDDDDVVAVIHVRSERRLVLAAKPERDDRGEPPDDEPARVDQDPFLLDLAGLGRIGFAEHQTLH